MKNIYVAILDTLVQLQISEALYAEVTAESETDISLEAIAPLLSVICTYTVATLDYEETSSSTSKYVLEGINQKGLIVGIAHLWRYNASQDGHGEALLSVHFDESHKKQIREARGLVRNYSYNQFNGSAEPHKKIIFDIPWSALN